MTTIGLSAFANCTGLTSLEIGDNVTSIKSAAFFNCKSLSSIVVKDGNQVYDSRNNCNAIILTKENELVLGCENTVIPDEMTSIGEYAFDGCVNLSSISIPNGVTNIGYDAFGGCSGLSSITLPDHLVSIGDLAFGDCTGLKSIIIPQNVEFIGFGAFSGCTALTSVTISSNVKEIGDGIFIDCDALTSIVVEEGNGTYDSRNNCNAIIHSETGELIAGCQNTVIPDGVKSIRGFAFEFLDGLSSITIPDGVTSIGEYAFYDCEGLTSVDLPNSLTTIGEGAFQRCIGLSAIKIPHGVTYIGEFAFDSCSGVTSVIIPNSVTFIGWDAFLDCTELKDVYCEAEQLSETEDGPGLFAEIQVFGLLWNELPITLHVPEASLDLYSTMDPWKYFKTIVSLTDDDPKSTGIKSLTDDSSNYPVGTYSIDGKRLQKVQRGLNIIRMKDGKTIKRIVK